MRYVVGKDHIVYESMCYLDGKRWSLSPYKAQGDGFIIQRSKKFNEEFIQVDLVRIRHSLYV